MKRVFNYSILAAGWIVMTGLLVPGLAGCSHWNSQRLDLASFRDEQALMNSFRDQRAVELDERLQKAPSPVNNPFQPSHPE